MRHKPHRPDGQPRWTDAQGTAAQTAPVAKNTAQARSLAQPFVIVPTSVALADTALQAWQIGRAWNRAAGVPKHPFTFGKAILINLAILFAASGLYYVVAAASKPLAPWLSVYPALGVMVLVYVHHNRMDKDWKARRNLLRSRTPVIGGK